MMAEDVRGFYARLGVEIPDVGIERRWALGLGIDEQSGGSAMGCGRG